MVRESLEIERMSVLESKMKSLFCLTVVLLLCSCASAPDVQGYVAGTSYSLGPTSANDPRLHHPQFYMDGSDSLPAWSRASPLSNK